MLMVCTGANNIIKHKAGRWVKVKLDKRTTFFFILCQILSLYVTFCWGFFYFNVAGEGYLLRLPTDVCIP